MTRYSTFSVTSPSEENSNIYNFQLHVQVQLGIGIFHVNLPSDYRLSVIHLAWLSFKDYF